MNFGLFEPLFGKQIPKQPVSAEPPPQAKPTPRPKVSQPKVKIEAPVVNNTQLGELFGELDKSKVIILLLAVAVAVMFVFFFYLNTRQKSQKQLMYKMQKQMRQLRG